MNDRPPAGPGQAAASLLAETACLLLVNGQTSVGTIAAVGRLGRALGSDLRVEARWGEILLHLDGAAVAVFDEAAPTGVDIGRVIAIETLVDDVCAGRVPAPAARVRLDAIRHRPPVALARFATMAAAGAAALAVIFGAPDLLTLVLVAISAGAGALLRRAVSHVSDNPFLQPFSAALLAGAASGGVIAWAHGLDTAPRLLVVCPCMVLVPGPHFLNGMIDLVRGRIPLGAARLVFANLIVVAICAGLLAGLALTSTAFPTAGAPIAVPFTYDVAAAGIAVAAYGSFFNMPWRLLAVPVAIGMLAHALRWDLLERGASLQLGAFCATLLVGAAVTPLARRFRLPFGACAFAAVVSLIPGVFMFEAASGTLAIIAPGAKAGPAVLLDVLENLATAAVILLAMSAGVILPKMCIDRVVDGAQR